MIWFDTLVSDQSLALLHVLPIDYVSDQTFGLRLKFETSVSDKVTQRVYIMYGLWLESATHSERAGGGRRARNSQR